MQAKRNGTGIAVRARQEQACFEQRTGSGVIALRHCQTARCAERFAPRRGKRSVNMQRQGVGQPASALAEQQAFYPQGLERRSKSQSGIGISLREGMTQGGAHIVQISGEAREPGGPHGGYCFASARSASAR